MCIAIVDIEVYNESGDFLQTVMYRAMGQPENENTRDAELE